MKTIILQNGRSASFIGAVLIKRLHHNTVIENIANISSCKYNDNDFFKDSHIVLVGEIPPLRIVREKLSDAMSITYLGGEKNNLTKFFLETHSNATNFDLSQDNIIASVVSFITTHIDKTFDVKTVPLIDALCGNKPYTKADKTELYRAIAFHDLSEDGVASLLKTTAENLNGLRMAGSLIEEHIKTYVKQTIDEESRDITINNVSIKAVSTNRRYCSPLAEALAEVHGTGCAYYDNERFRHFEIRDKKGLLPPNFNYDIRKLFNGTGSKYEMRFRIPRQHTLIGV